MDKNSILQQTQCFYSRRRLSCFYMPALILPMAGYGYVPLLQHKRVL